MNLDKLRAQLIAAEGVRLKVYLDSKGIETIGVGRNLRDRGISRGEADLLLEHDIAEVLQGLSQAFSWYGTLDEVRQRVLADVAFNVGLVGLIAFRKMIVSIVAKDWALAERELLDSDAAREAPTRYRALGSMLRTGRDMDPTQKET